MPRDLLNGGATVHLASREEAAFSEERPTTPEREEPFRQVSTRTNRDQWAYRSVSAGTTRETLPGLEKQTFYRRKESIDIRMHPPETPSQR